MERYRLSFTFGGLLGHETRVIAKEYLKDRDWTSAKSRILKQNLLQKTRGSSSRRYFGEIRDRLSSAHDWEVDLVTSDASFEESITVVFAITTRYYRLLRDFVVEVVRHKWLGRDTHLKDYDFDTFFEGKIPNHKELTEISETTRKKLREVTLRVLREGNLIATNKRDIQKLSIPTSSLRKYVDSKDFDSLQIFLLSNREIDRVVGVKV